MLGPTQFSEYLSPHTFQSEVAWLGFTKHKQSKCRNSLGKLSKDDIHSGLELWDKEINFDLDKHKASSKRG